MSKQLTPRRFSAEDYEDVWEYFSEYYGPEGMYHDEPFNTLEWSAMRPVVELALGLYASCLPMAILKTSPTWDGIGYKGGQIDSIDREFIRDIVLALCGEEPWGCIFSPDENSESSLAEKRYVKELVARSPVVYFNNDICI